MNNVKFQFFRGDTYERLITITNWDKNIDSIYFTVKHKDTDKEPVLQKTLGKGITKVDGNELTSTFLLTIDATDTDDMKTDYDYSFDVEIISSNIKKTIIKGTLTLTTDITKTINEV